MCVVHRPVSVRLAPVDADFAEALSASVTAALRVARRWAASEAEAAELAQEALLVAWRRRDVYEASAPVEAWVCAIVRNLGRNARRKCREVLVDAEAPEPISGDVLPDELLEREERVEQVRRALQALPELECRVLSLRYFDGVSTAAIDAELGLTGSGARAVLQRGRRRLRGLLAA